MDNVHIYFRKHKWVLLTSPSSIQTNHTTSVLSTKGKVNPQHTFKRGLKLSVSLQLGYGEGSRTEAQDSAGPQKFGDQ